MIEETIEKLKRARPFDIAEGPVSESALIVRNFLIHACVQKNESLVKEFEERYVEYIKNLVSGEKEAMHTAYWNCRYSANLCLDLADFYLNSTNLEEFKELH